MTIPKGVALYAALAAILAYMLSRKKRGKLRAVALGAAAGAGAALLAPKAGVSLPGLPPASKVQR